MTLQRTLRRWEKDVHEQPERPPIRNYNASERYKSQTGAAASTSASTLATELVSLEEEIKKMQSKLASLSLENERLQTELNSLKFGFNRFIRSDVDMTYYTGMSSRHFLASFAFLDADGICSRLSQVKSSQLYLGRVALSAIGWYQKGPCVNYDYTIKI